MKRLGAVRGRHYGIVVQAHPWCIRVHHTKFHEVSRDQAEPDLAQASLRLPPLHPMLARGSQ